MLLEELNGGVHTREGCGEFRVIVRRNEVCVCDGGPAFRQLGVCEAEAAPQGMQAIEMRQRLLDLHNRVLQATLREDRGTRTHAHTQTRVLHTCSTHADTNTQAQSRTHTHKNYYKVMLGRHEGGEREKGGETVTSCLRMRMDKKEARPRPHTHTHSRTHLLFHEVFAL